MNALANRGWYWLACLLIPVLVTGCGSSSGPRVIPAWGKITYKGEPLEFGTVTFSPVDPNAAVATSAQIVDGRYQTEKGQGISPGTYKVVINVQRIPADLNETSKQKSKPGAVASKELLIPEKYASYKTTDLELDVKASANSVAQDFDLDD